MRRFEFYSCQELKLGERGRYLLFSKKEVKTKCMIINVPMPWRIYSQKKIFLVFKKEAWFFYVYPYLLIFRKGSLHLRNKIIMINHSILVIATIIYFISQKCYNNFWLFTVILFFITFFINNLSSYSLFLRMFITRIPYN